MSTDVEVDFVFIEKIINSTKNLPVLCAVNSISRNIAAVHWSVVDHNKPRPFISHLIRSLQISLEPFEHAWLETWIGTEEIEVEGSEVDQSDVHAVHVILCLLPKWHADSVNEIREVGVMLMISRNKLECPIQMRLTVH